MRGRGFHPKPRGAKGKAVHMGVTMDSKPLSPLQSSGCAVHRWNAQEMTLAHR